MTTRSDARSTKRRVISLLAVLTLAAAPIGRASPRCGPAAVCAALAGIQRPGLQAPDLAALTRAKDVMSALRAADPALPRGVAPAVASLRGEIEAWAAMTHRRSPAALPRLGPRVERALAALLAGARIAEASRSRALVGTASLGDRLLAPASTDGSLHADSPDLRSLAASLDTGALRAAVATVAESVAGAMAAIGPSYGACEGEPSPPLEIGDMIAVDTSGTPTSYTKPYLVTLDLGGCDRYETAGGADGLRASALGITIDLGGDADSYANPPETYALGASVAGIGVLVDDGGDDVYNATGYGALGAGITGGVGLLVDLAGNDRYLFSGSGGGFGAQGIGTIGYGALLDLDGADEYSYTFDPGSAPAGFSRLLFMQGSGGVAGIGVLADARGGDRYTVHTLGTAVSSEGQGAGDFIGTGTLVDAEGDDVRIMQAEPISAANVGSGGVAGQGSGVLDGAGLSLDGGGNDTYTLRATASGPKGASASAVGQGFALGLLDWVGGAALVDAGGNDSYLATAAASSDDPARSFAGVQAQAVGSYEGAALLADLGGDDTYETSTDAVSRSEFAQGVGLAAGGVGVLVDGAGNDRYASEGRAQGFGSNIDFGDGFDVPGGTGVLVDGGGANSFSGPGAEAWFWQQGRNGVGVGVDLGGGQERALAFVDYVFWLFGLERPGGVASARAA